MNLRIVVPFMLSGLLSFATDYSPQIRSPLNEIRKDIAKNGLPCLQGYTNGFPGHVGAFIANFRKIDGNCTVPDVELMLKDSNPVVRLVGARIALNSGLDPNLLTKLESDSALLWVGPFSRQKEEFRQMTVQEVLTEMRNDLLFQLRMDYGESVVLERITAKDEQNGSKIILGKLPEYPSEMARARIAGDVTAKIVFRDGSAKPEVHILKSSHREFEEPTIWALSKWEIKSASPATKSPAATTEFECHLVFTAAE